MENDAAYDTLTNEICVRLGFCGSTVNGEPRHVDQFIPEVGRVTAEEFVAWVLVAEGLDPKGASATKYAPSLHEAFVRHMGSEVVDAGRMK